MALFAGELLEVAPKDPASVAVVGGYIVVPDANLVFGGGAGLMPNGSFAVLDLSTESARAFTGIASNPGIASGSCVAAAGYAWTTNINTASLFRINPVTGSVTTIGLPGSGVTNIAKVAATTSSIIVIGWGPSNRVLAVDTATLTATLLSTAAHGVTHPPVSDGTTLHYSDGTNYRQMDPATGSTTTIGAFGGPSPTLGSRGFISGSTWWFHTGDGVASKLIVPPYSYTHYSLTLVPGGNYGQHSDLVEHTDGAYYGYGASDYLIRFDPAGHGFTKDALTPSRGRRYTVVSAAGKLWIPSGEPLS